MDWGSVAAINIVRLPVDVSEMQLGLTTYMACMQINTFSTRKHRFNFSQEETPHDGITDQFEYAGPVVMLPLD